MRENEKKSFIRNCPIEGGLADKRLVGWYLFVDT
jgi:hypothetical protein